MKKRMPCLILFILFLQQFSAQEQDGVVALQLPVRNSLRFNKYAINPTFSFVREQNRYVSFTNKREWAGFENAPQTYLFSYSGRFKENLGAGLGVFQQNYGILTTFGGVANMAYNAVINRDQNLTFGLNLSAYKSGLNNGDVITNYQDPSLQNIPSNTLITINPGINYGTLFFDFGVSLNNVVAYNFTTSQMLEDNPEQSIQGHIMYTGYVDSRGFFDESKFTGFVRSEFKKDQTIISGIAMITVPKGIWVQVGYNTFYGASGGVGFNITNNIGLEYNYEKAIGELSNFGSSHEITVAYKFNNNNKRFIYSGDDDEEGLLSSNRNRKRSSSKRKTPSKKPVVRSKTTDAKEAAKKQAEAEAAAKLEQERLAAEAKVKAEAEKQRLAEAAKKQAEAEAATKLEQERLAAEAKAKAEAEKQRLAEAAKKQAEADAAAKLEQERLEAEAKAKEEAENKRLAEEANKELDTVMLDGVLIPISKDKESLEMKRLTELTVNARIDQQNLINRLKEAVAGKQQDLADLKEENDLSEKGIYNQPKPFKSTSAENAKIEAIKLEIDNVLKSQNSRITELESMYKTRLKNTRKAKDEVNTYYANEIEKLKSQQAEILKTKENLLNQLVQIKEDTDFERKRRIKRAAFDNEQERYNKDRLALKTLKENTSITEQSPALSEFDFGEVTPNNILIINSVANVQPGYYLVLAVHSDTNKRDDFVKKVLQFGDSAVDFFYDVNSSKYYIYTKVFGDLTSARSAMQSNKSTVYSSKSSIVNIQN